MVGTPEGRELLRLIEEDFRTALEVLHEERRNEREAVAKQLAAINRRYLTTTATVVAVCVAMLAVVVVGMLLLSRQQNRLNDVVAQQTRSRHAAVVASCQGRDDISVGILGFIRKVDPRDLARAAGSFPIEPDCDAYARSIGAP